MDPVQTVEVAELDIDRLVQVPVELRAEREELTCGVLALVEIQRQEVCKSSPLAVPDGGSIRPSFHSNSGALT